MTRACFVDDPARLFMIAIERQYDGRHASKHRRIHLETGLLSLPIVSHAPVVF